MSLVLFWPNAIVGLKTMGHCHKLAASDTENVLSAAISEPLQSRGGFGGLLPQLAACSGAGVAG